MVEELARNEEAGTTLTISLPEGSDKLDDAQLGDSIAVNGVCLTATSITKQQPPGGEEGEGGSASGKAAPPPKSPTHGCCGMTSSLRNV